MMQARSAAGAGTLEPVRRDGGVAERAQRERGGREDGERAVLGAVRHELVELVQRPVSYSTVEMVRAETLLKD